MVTVAVDDDSLRGEGERPLPIILLKCLEAEAPLLDFLEPALSCCMFGVEADPKRVCFKLEEAKAPKEEHLFFSLGLCVSVVILLLSGALLLL